MKKINLSHKGILKFSKWAFLILICLFISLLTIRAFHYLKIQKLQNIISNIDSIQLKNADVFGDNLPPEPNLEADKTLAGADSNTNNIRDDVEISIFKSYPDSPKIRSVLLQYAMALQMEVTQPILNKEIAIKIINEQNRAYTCLSDTLVPRVSPESSRSIDDIEKIEGYINFVKEKQFNTDERKKEDDIFYKNLDSEDNSLNFFDSLLDSKINSCDIDLSQLKK